MIERTFNSDIVAKATAQVEYGPDEEHVKDWLAYEGNVAFTNDTEDVGMFERVLQHEDAVYGHYFFFSRGRKALDVAKEMVEAIFDPQYNVNRIVGITPVSHRGAIWMNKQLGFKSCGTVELQGEEYECVMLTAKEWKSSNE